MSQNFLHHHSLNRYQIFSSKKCGYWNNYVNLSNVNRNIIDDVIQVLQKVEPLYRQSQTYHPPIFYIFVISTHNN